MSFFSSGFPKVKLGVSVCSFVACSTNFEAEDSATKDLPKTGFIVVDVVVIEAVSEKAGASFSALDWGAEKLKDEFELSFSLGLAPNKNAEFSEPEA